MKPESSIPVIFEESFKNAPPERIFNDLKRAAQNSNKLTLNEMMPQKHNVEKKVFQNIKASVEMLNKKDNKESESIPFFKRAFNIVNDDMNNADEGRNENNENINENSDLLN